MREAAWNSRLYMYLVDYDYGIGELWLHNGLLDEVGNTKKPAFEAYKTMIAKVDYFTSLDKVAQGQYKYSFANKDPVYILWCDAGSCSLPAEISGQVKVTDHLGNEETKDIDQVTLTESPVFVE